MPKVTFVTAVFFCLVGCINTSASYDGKRVSFTTQRLFSDTGVESAALELAGDGKARLEMQGYQSEHSKALELARQALTLMAPANEDRTHVAADHAPDAELGDLFDVDTPSKE